MNNTTEIIDLDQIHGNQPYEFAKFLIFNEEKTTKTKQYNRVATTKNKNNEQVQEERTGGTTESGSL